MTTFDDAVEAMRLATNKPTVGYLPQQVASEMLRAALPVIAQALRDHATSEDFISWRSFEPGDLVEGLGK